VRLSPSVAANGMAVTNSMASSAGHAASIRKC
jgi:hypothetical protein